jgi:protein-L-isoaspartate(D-aspartate) O-methyltransferase
MKIPEHHPPISDEEQRRLRDLMVSEQLQGEGISNPSVLRAMKSVPRHWFVPDSAQPLAYVDSPLAIGYGQTISQPRMVAILMDALELQGHERVLDVGTGSGYQAAVLSMLCKEVYSVEMIQELAESAQLVLLNKGYHNVSVWVTDGSVGLPVFAPYDAIVVAAASPDVPGPLVDQLAVGGRLVIPVGDVHHQTLLRIRKHLTYTDTETLSGCVFVPLVGTHGWPVS